MGACFSSELRNREGLWNDGRLKFISAAPRARQVASEMLGQVALSPPAPDQLSQPNASAASRLKLLNRRYKAHEDENAYSSAADSTGGFIAASVVDSPRSLRSVFSRRSRRIRVDFSPFKRGSASPSVHYNSSFSVDGHGIARTLGRFSAGRREQAVSQRATLGPAQYTMLGTRADVEPPSSDQAALAERAEPAALQSSSADATRIIPRQTSTSELEEGRPPSRRPRIRKERKPWMGPLSPNPDAALPSFSDSKGSSSSPCSAEMLPPALTTRPLCPFMPTPNDSVSQAAVVLLPCQQAEAAADVEDRERSFVEDKGKNLVKDKAQLLFPCEDSFAFPSLSTRTGSEAEDRRSLERTAYRALVEENLEDVGRPSTPIPAAAFDSEASDPPAFVLGSESEAPLLLLDEGGALSDDSVPIGTPECAFREVDSTTEARNASAEGWPGHPEESTEGAEATDALMCDGGQSFVQHLYSDISESCNVAASIHPAPLDSCEEAFELSDAQQASAECGATPSAIPASEPCNPRLQTPRSAPDALPLRLDTTVLTSFSAGLHLAVPDYHLTALRRLYRDLNLDPSPSELAWQLRHLSRSRRLWWSQRCAMDPHRKPQLGIGYLSDGASDLAAVARADVDAMATAAQRLEHGVPGHVLDAWSAVYDHFGRDPTVRELNWLSHHWAIGNSSGADASRLLRLD